MSAPLSSDQHHTVLDSDLHLGLTPWHFSDLSAPSLTEQARYAESLGYESIWLPENHFGEHALPDPLTLLAAVAGATQNLRLGTTSYLLTLRNPLQAAEQVAVLDQLSGGRVMLGVGRGYAPDMLKAFHVPVKEKRRIFAWTLDLMRRAWAGEAVSLDGNPEHAVSVHPQPAQKPEPPLWVAAFGPKALAQAGRLGLPYLCSPVEGLKALEANYAAHREAALEAGVEPPSIVPLMRTVFVSEDATLVRRLQGELIEQRQAIPRPGAQSEAQRNEPLEDWAIIGSPEHVREQVERYQQALGMTHLIATRLRVRDLHEAEGRESVRLLAELLGKDKA